MAGLIFPPHQLILIDGDRQDIETGEVRTILKIVMGRYATKYGLVGLQVVVETILAEFLAEEKNDNKH